MNQDDTRQEDPIADAPTPTPWPAGPATLFSKGHRHETPPGTQSFGMTLFLLALGMLFLGGLLAYWILRVRTGAAAGGLPLHSIRVPQALLFSTPCMVAASYFIHRALGAVRRGEMRTFRTLLTAGAALSVLFVLLQAPALWSLWERHQEARVHLGAANNGEAADSTRTDHAFYGSILFLIVIHALHVLGGAIPLAAVWTKATKGAYTRESHGALRMLVWYWHFLDIVWLMMFATFWLLG